MEAGQQKKIIIISIYSALLLVMILSLYLWLRPVASCTDGKQNQNETGVDCGGVCANKCAVVFQAADLLVGQAGFVESGLVNKYDVYAEVTNPNGTVGSRSFQYEFVVLDAAGAELAKKSGEGFILPGEKKYVIENNVLANVIPSRVDFKITGSEWVEFAGYQKPELRVVNKNYSEVNSGTEFAAVVGLLKNESTFDFATIRLDIILKNSDGKVIALNATEMSTVKAGENRDFKAFWPGKFSGTVNNFEVQPEVNVFDSEAFVQRYFRDQQF